MHAYLLIGNDKAKAEEEINSRSKKLGGLTLEFPITKIAQVRELGIFLKLKVTRPTTIIIRDAETATLDALNAFLKTLEEPQENVQFILTASSEYKVIPTIVSRCQIVRLNTENLILKDEKKYSEFLNMALGEKFLVVDKIKKREEAVDFIKNLVFLWHSELTKDKNLNQLGHAVKEAQKTLLALEANGNIGIQLTRFVISL